MTKVRKLSIGFCGGAYGDEGKGRIVDKYVSDFAQKREVIVYRDNGGANAGHTVEFESGKRVALHQIPSGIFHQRATVVLGKGMVIHPADLLEELRQVKEAAGKKGHAKILIDEMAVLSLDTHRAFEAVLKDWEEGGKGSTGRGISPAYVDVLLRHPLRMRDLLPFNREKIRKHYRLYEGLVHGLGKDIEDIKVPQLLTDIVVSVGSYDAFSNRLEAHAAKLKNLITDVTTFMQGQWENKNVAVVFEKAQAIGLDSRWGVYPDVTASDCTFDGIYSATNGVIDPDTIETRAGVIKATYMSSVGTRKLPTQMDERLAHRIREDANEYGSTTKRPRTIANVDIPALKYFAKVGKCNALVLTHMDIVYPDTPIKVCIAYTRKGKVVDYRPDQEFLSSVKPQYVELKPWSKEKIMTTKIASKLPIEAKSFLKFIEKHIGIPVLMITTGPKREQGIIF